MVSNAGGLIHGTLMVGALLAAASARRETFASTIGAVAIAVFLYWLSHAYSELTEERLETGDPLTRSSVARTLVRELTIVAGAATPLLALLISWAVGAPLGTAVIAALWVSVAIIVGIEIVAGVRAELTGKQLAVQIAVGGLLGMLVFVLHIVLH